MSWKTPTKDQAAAPSRLGRNIAAVIGVAITLVGVVFTLTIALAEMRVRADGRAPVPRHHVSDQAQLALKHFVTLGLDPAFPFSLHAVPRSCAAELPKCPNLLTGAEWEALREAGLVDWVGDAQGRFRKLRLQASLTDEGFAEAHRLGLL